MLSSTCRSFKPQNFLNENACYPIIRELGSTITIAISVSGVRFTFKVNCVILHALLRAKLKMADACVQTHSAQAGDNLDMDELEVQAASATLNLTDDNMCQKEADSDYDSDCDIDDVDDALFF